MPKFKYKAMTAQGTLVDGVEEAQTSTLLHRALVARELQPIEVVEKKSVLQFEITRRKVPRKELMHFSRQLAVFIRAGIPILDAMDVIVEEEANKLFKRALEDMTEALRSGETFAGAVAAHPEAFPRFYQEIVRSAELTGNLDNILDQLAEYIDRDLEARQKIVSALTYPAVVFVMSIVTVVVLTAFVMPRFVTFFKSFNARLPLATRVLLNASGFMKSWWFLFAGVAGAGLVALLVGLRTEKGNDMKDAFLLRLPIIGDVVRDAVLERFCRVLSSLVQAAVPLPDALTVTADATSNAVYRRGLMTAREAMLHGDGLAGPLAATDLFPASARQMFRVGEDTGTLDDQLHTAATYFDRELDFKLKRLTSLFEPAVIIFMGVLVGFVAIALVSAMYGIFHQVNIAK